MIEQALIAAAGLSGLLLGVLIAGSGDKSDGCNGHHWQYMYDHSYDSGRPRTSASTTYNKIVLEHETLEGCEDCSETRISSRVVARADKETFRNEFGVENE